MEYLYPLLLEASLHETIWGGRRLEQEGWKSLPPGDKAIGESWETENSTIIQNGPHAGKTLGMLVSQLGAPLLGKQAIAIFGERFPLLAKFIDANTQLSVQVHPDDRYAARYEHGKLGKTEFWYILAAEPGATIVHGFKTTPTREDVLKAIQTATLDHLLHEETVQAGDIIFVPAGTVHAIGQGVLLYELQEYSDITYRMYDYGRLTADGTPRELHIERSLEVAHYSVSPHIKMSAVSLPAGPGYEDRCLIACPYFVTRELHLKAHGNKDAAINGQTEASCAIITSLDANVQINFGPALSHCETVSRGQTAVLPAELGTFTIAGQGTLLYSYVPAVTDLAWELWRAGNEGKTM